MQNKLMVLTLTTLIALTGCGSTSSSDKNAEVESNISIRGKVIDAEIKDATVFLDLNKNGEFDKSEPNTKTKKDGSFELVLTKANREEENYRNQTAPLVAFGGRDIRSGKEFEDYLTSMINGKDEINITPFTTLIATSLDEGNSSVFSKTSNKTTEEIADELKEKIAQIKKNLAELFGINEALLEGDPIALAKQGDKTLLAQSLKLHNSAKVMKKAMKKDVRRLKRSILKSYRSLARELKKLKKSALKKNDDALLKVLDTAMNDETLFDGNLVKEVRAETRTIIQSINTFWENQEGVFSDDTLNTAINDVETIVEENTQDPTGNSSNSTNRDNGSQNQGRADSSSTTHREEDSSNQNQTSVDNNISNREDCLSTVSISDDSNFTDTFPSDNIEYSAQGETVKDIENTFNKAREQDSTVSKRLIMPLQEKWDSMTIQEKALFLLNAERYDRGIKPFEGVSSEVIEVAQNYANLLYDSGKFGHNEDGSPWERLDRVDAIKENKDFLGFAENLYVAGASNDYTKNPIAKAIYNWIYSDKGSSWGHRKFCLVNKLNDNSGENGQEGLIGFGLKEGDEYTYYPNFKSTIVVMNAFDPSASWNHSNTIKVPCSSSLAENNTKIEIDKPTAIRFLNKASFGATKESIEELMSKGVEKWLDEQLSMPLKDNQYLIKTIEMAKKMSPEENTYTIDEYLADNDIVFNKNVGSFHSPRYRMTAWFDISLRSPDQLRAKVTYALSQIIVESDFEPIFTRRGEALATYFDILQRHAFGRYEDLLNEISLNSGMGVFLTFNGSKKEYQNEANSTVYPDENYAREIMQLFSLGLEKLNIDGTPILDDNGNPTPTYTQEDVNQLSRVFTGWDLKRNPRFGLVGFKRGDYTHPLEFTASYHDSGEKKVLGQTIPAGLSGKEDIQRAVSIIMSQNSVAPYISKNLIMRLVKSNPSPSYIARVASVFNSTRGDLKAVVKAIFLDEELWQDLKEKNVVKFKEPLVAYTSFLRAFNVKPMPKWFYCGYGGPSDANASNCQVVEDAFLFNDTRDYLNQGAGLAPTVFNFYDNSFVPNSQPFKDSKSVAPEISIMNDTTFINFSNTIRNSLFGHEKNYMLNDWVWDYSGNRQPRKQYATIVDYVNDAPIRRYIPFYYVGADKFLLDVTEELNVMEEVIDGDTNGDFANLKDHQVQEYTDDEKAVEALVHHLNLKLTAGALSQEREAIITNGVKYEIFNKYNVGDPNAVGTDESGSNKKRQILERVVFRAIRAVVTSSEYMTE